MTRDPADDPATRLDAALGALPRDVPPGRDLWPAIRSQLEPAATAKAAGHGRSPWAWRIAAALALVSASSLITAALVGRDTARPVAQVPAVPAAASAGVQALPAAFGPSHRLSPEYGEAHRQLSALLQERIGRMPPAARSKLGDNLAQLRRAADAINEALAEQPGDPLLEELLLSTYQEELAVLAAANQLTAAANPGPESNSSRIQL